MFPLMTRKYVMDFLMARRNFTWLEALEFVHGKWCGLDDKDRRVMLVQTSEKKITLKRFFKILWFDLVHRPIKLNFK